MEIVHKMRINCGLEPAWGVSSGSWAKTLLQSLLISFILITVAGYIHFRPIGTSLFVSAWVVFSNSLWAFVLSVVLDFAVETVLAVPAEVVCGLNLSVVLLRHWVWLLEFAWKPRISPILEGSDLVFLVLGVAVALFMDGRQWSSQFWNLLPFACWLPPGTCRPRW